MERDGARRVRELIHDAYRSDLEADEFLTRVWGNALRASGCDEGTLLVSGLGCLYATRQQEHIEVEFTAERAGGTDLDDFVAPEEGAAWEGESGGGDERRVAIVYREQRIGEMRWRGEAEGPRQDDFFEHLGRELAFFVKRHEVATRAHGNLGQPLLLVGVSDELRRLERQIEKAAGVDFPVLVQGEFGSEKLHVAYAVHACSDRRDGSFVEVKCGSQRQGGAGTGPDEWFRRAEGGSVFFNGIDELTPEMQAVLPEYLESQLGQWGRRGNGSGPAPVRLMASSTRDLREMVQRGVFSRALLAELDFLNLEVPALRRRRSDLGPLVEYTFGKYRRRPAQGLSAESLRVCADYDWPENVFQVERTMARLAAMSEVEEITLDALRAVAPEIVAGAEQSAPHVLAATPTHLLLPAPAAEETPVEAAEPAAPACDPQQIVLKVVQRDYTFPGGLHPCLRKALRYIGEHFERQIALSALAEQACISASHLSFLFRSQLGVSFKSFLGMVRIEKAKRLLVERSDLKITDISLDVGFGDLSHFEKTFKRLASVNPREFRRQQWTA
jgi:DNA-binding NtrC family response regulator